jgi:hypothetical protein
MAGKRKTDASDSTSESRRHRIDLVMTEARNAGLVGGPRTR